MRPIPLLLLLLLTLTLILCMAYMPTHTHTRTPAPVPPVPVLPIPHSDPMPMPVLPPKPVSKAVLVKPSFTLTRPSYRGEALAMVKGFEGYYSKPYSCPSGVTTIGYGHTGRGVARSYMSEHDATLLLEKDMGKARDRVLAVVTVPLSCNQLEALTSFTFNCGQGSLRKLVSGEGRLNSGNYDSITRILPLYCKSNGKTLRGLEKRRKAEITLWNKPEILLVRN